MTRRLLPVAAVAAIAAMLVVAAPTYAQRGGRHGGNHGGYHGGGNYGGYRGGYSGYRGGYSGWPYSGFSLGLGRTWSYPSYYPNYAWSYPGYSSYPGSSLSYYYPSLSYYYPEYTYVNPATPYVYPQAETYVTPPAYASAPPSGSYEESSIPPVSPAASAYAARMTIRVPPGADLWIDDYKSGQTGEVRKFESPATLEPGKNYTYTLRASWYNGDQLVNSSRKVQVQPGRDVFVDMTAPQP